VPLSNAADYPLWVNFAIFLGAAGLVWTAGTRLTGYVDAVSEKTGLGQAFVGMLLLGGITSLPELANAITSAVTGNPALAVNNLLGSAAINIVLLAIADAVVGRDALTSAVAKPSTMMMGTLCLLVLAMVAIAITVGDVAVVGIGIWGFSLCALSIGAFWLCAGYDDRAPWAVKDKPDPEEAALENATAEHSLRTLLIKTAIAGAVIFFAGYALSQTGDALAEQTGLGTGMVGFVLIGTSTSMPELSSIFAAIRLHRYEMAFGQILGTNFINLSLILVVDLFFTGGPVVNELGRFEVVSSLLGAILIGVFLVGLLERRNRTVFRMGYDSLGVMVLFAGGLVLLHFMQ
jgi:cation:H+ antiporter